MSDGFFNLIISVGSIARIGFKDAVKTVFIFGAAIVKVGRIITGESGSDTDAAKPSVVLRAMLFFGSRCGFLFARFCRRLHTCRSSG
jgi:hypothetical protein